jgi:membrane protein YdbS with pleckstrin-like domain
MLTKISTMISQGEEGHGKTLPGMLLAAAGAIVLAIGAAGDTGWLTITGGIVLAVGLIAMMVLNHIVVAWDVYARLEALEKKK